MCSLCSNQSFFISIYFIQHIEQPPWRLGEWQLCGMMVLYRALKKPAVSVHLPHGLTSIPCSLPMDFSSQLLLSQYQPPSLFQVIHLPTGCADSDHYCKSFFTLPIIIPISFFEHNLSSKGKQNALLHSNGSSIV